MTSQKIYPYHDKLFGCRIPNLTTSLRYSQHQDIVNHTKFSVYKMYTHIHKEVKNILFLASSPFSAFYMHENAAAGAEDVQ